MVEIPDSLVERLKERQVVLVAGLGCSELAGASGWNELTEALAGRLVFSDARQVVARLTAAGRKQLGVEISSFERMVAAIGRVMRTA